MEFSLIQVILNKPLGAGAVLAEHHQLLHRVVGCGGPPRGGGSDALLHLHPGKVKGTGSHLHPEKERKCHTCTLVRLKGQCHTNTLVRLGDSLTPTPW